MDDAMDRARRFYQEKEPDSSSPPNQSRGKVRTYARPAGSVPLANWQIEIQGKRIKVVCKTGRTRKPQENERGVITEFSKRARKRMLEKIASVDWKAAGKGMLITVTYPDDQSNHTMDERKIHRFIFNRWIVNRCGRVLACFWRVEWMPRKSGKYEGELRPHIHFLYLGMHTINFRGIRERWERTIGAQEHTQIDVTYLTLGDIVSVYVAKYCAKEASNLLLDNVPYRNRTGRHSGELRKELIPYHPLETVDRITQGMLLAAKRTASGLLWWWDPRYDEGFTILGDEAVKLIAELHGMRIDSYGEETYTSRIG